MTRYYRFHVTVELAGAGSAIELIVHATDATHAWEIAYAAYGTSGPAIIIVQ